MEYCWCKNPEWDNNYANGEVCIMCHKKIKLEKLKSSKKPTAKAQAILYAIRKVRVGNEIIIHNDDGSVWCILRLIAREHEEKPIK